MMSLRNKCVFSFLFLLKLLLSKIFRYKIVVMVTMGPKHSQAIQIASRCMWYTPTDKFASWEFSSETFFAVGVVFGLYYE